jgi:membrane dipeptidase
MRVAAVYTLIIAMCAAAPAFAKPAPAAKAASDRAAIMAILKKTPLIDGHNDLPWEMRERFAGDLDKVDLSKSTTGIGLHTDIPRLRAGGVGAQFWSVYVPAELQGLESNAMVIRQIDLVRRIVARYPNDFAMAVTADDVVRIHKSGKIASLLGVEGGEAIAGDLALLRQLRAQGVGYMTLCHSKTTAWVDSATDAPKHGGLSPFGEEVVREMNRIGMLVDLSHVSADAMRDALRVSTAPVIFSHSSARAIDSAPRNVPDDVLASLPANGGVVMVNFYPVFVSEPYRLWAAERAGIEARSKALEPGDPARAKAALDAWTAANPPPKATLSQVADHIEHVRAIAGVDHVGLGSDFDGIPTTPEGLGGVDAYPALLAELARRGWSSDDLAKLAGGNVLRVMRAAEAVAARGGR